MKTRFGWSQTPTGAAAFGAASIFSAYGVLRGVVSDPLTPGYACWIS